MYSLPSTDFTQIKDDIPSTNSCIPSKDSIPTIDSIPAWTQHQAKTLYQPLTLYKVTNTYHMDWDNTRVILMPPLHLFLKYLANIGLTDITSLFHWGIKTQIQHTSLTTIELQTKGFKFSKLWRMLNELIRWQIRNDC